MQEVDSFYPQHILNTAIEFSHIRQNIPCMKTWEHERVHACATLLVLQQRKTDRNSTFNQAQIIKAESTEWRAAGQLHLTSSWHGSCLEQNSNTHWSMHNSTYSAQCNQIITHTSKGTFTHAGGLQTPKISHDKDKFSPRSSKSLDSRNHKIK
jgi:hypothetical protein